MSAENLSLYTEEDPNGRLSESATRVTYAGLTNAETAYLYYDKGVNFFNGDFLHHVDILASSGSSGAGGNVWALSNDLGDYWTLRSGGKNMLCAQFVQETYDTDHMRLFLFEQDGGDSYANQDTYFFVYSTPYYLKIKRDESVGTYGTFYCYAYSDTARTNLLITQSIALHSSEKDFRYIYACQTRHDDGAGSVNGYTENLDLSPAPPAVGRSQGLIF